MEQDLRHVAGVEEDVRKLSSSLQIIQSVVIDVDWRKLKEAEKAWLNMLKSVAYDIDDVLDERSYQDLKSRYASIKRKVWPFILLSACYRFPCVASPNRIAVKISNLSAKLDAINYLDLQSLKRNDKHNVITSDIDIPEVKGRDAEKEKLVTLLLEERTSSELPKIHPISLVGMPGIGKTTLAKLVYKDEMVKTHFDIRIWVLVSKPYDKIEIAKAILKSLIGRPPNTIELQSIAVEIQHYLKGKKFLLVLDDVWNDDLMEWKELEDCLVSGSLGSKILVTTRNKKVAKLMGCIDADIFQVGFLPEKECWSLFCETAFHGWSSEQRRRLETIGLTIVERIVERCAGLPLAVKTVACLLCFTKSLSKWKKFSERELGEKDEVHRYIFRPLRLSYCDLPLPLKQCFLYCVTFPKDYWMSKDELIGLWSTHGFLKPLGDKNLEMVGHDYFHDLGMRSLFQDFEVREKFNRFNKTYTTLHSIVHDFANYMMGKERLYIELYCAEDVVSFADATYSDCIYHLHVKLGQNVKFLDTFYDLGKLRSLVVSPPKKVSLIGAALPRIFKEFTCLRSLSLSRCGLDSIPSNINNLIHLRWLKLSKNYALKELPETICKLYHLQTLSVNWCHGLLQFPKGVEKLINLRHLKNDYTYFLLPKGIGKLSGLQKLLRITIDPKSKSPFTLRDLKNLNNIGGSLTIFFMERERHTLVKDAKHAHLDDKKHITTLSLNFPEKAVEEWIQKEDEGLVEALNPPPCLEMLRITCYKGAEFPSWINTLTSLKRLKLWYWDNCKHLPALAKLPCLEYIEFCYFGRVKKVTAEFYRMDGIMEASSSTDPLFPKLKSLQFMNMISWEEWNDYEGDEEVMPCLSFLSIENCPKLKALPNFIREKAALQKHISY